jgi:predicted kinase
MAKLSLVKGTTSYRAYVFIQDSSVTTGAGLTGLTYQSGSLTAYYVRPGATATSITLATQTATGAYSSGGFVVVDGTNMPGLYRFDIPDAALATGVNAVVVMLKCAANMVPCVLEIELTATDNQTASTGGLTNLDAAISTRSTVTTAQVNAEVVDALATDTYAEPSSVPAATASLSAKIGWLMALGRNKLTQTSTTQTLRNDADNGSIGTATVSDDSTTFTRAEWS